jgi:hypothetical protein
LTASENEVAVTFVRREADQNLPRLCSEARVVGVQFWDFRHGQTGGAPNAVELHPILGFACLSG